MGAWHQRPGALMEEHLRTHPEPLRARLWLRRFLEDLLPRERAEAAKRIYSRLRQVWATRTVMGSTPWTKCLRLHICTACGLTLTGVPTLVARMPSTSHNQRGLPTDML